MVALTERGKWSILWIDKFFYEKLLSFFSTMEFFLNKMMLISLCYMFNDRTYLRISHSYIVANVCTVLCTEDLDQVK